MLGAVAFDIVYTSRDANATASLPWLTTYTPAAAVDLQCETSPNTGLRPVRCCQHTLKGKENGVKPRQHCDGALHSPCHSEGSGMEHRLSMSSQIDKEEEEEEEWK